MDRAGQLQGGTYRVPPFTTRLGPKHALLLLPAALFLLNDLFTPGVLDWFPDGAFSFSWFAVASVAILAFSGAYCATRWRAPSLLAFALGFLALTLYVIAVASSYEASETLWRTVCKIGWLGIPLAVAFWARGAVLIADETRFSGRTGTAPSWDRFLPVLIRKLPRPLRRRLIAPFEQLTPWKDGEPEPWRRLARRLFAGVTLLEIGAVWLPAIALVVLGSASDLVYRLDGEVLAPWRGHTYVPQAGHWAMALWIGAVLLSTTLFLVAAFRARPSGLSITADRRARYAAWASGAFFVLAGLLLFTSLGVVPEPLGDLALSVYACLIALVIIDADEAKETLAGSQLGQRSAVVLAATTGAIAVVVSVGPPPTRSAILACVLGAALPLSEKVITWLRLPQPVIAVHDLGADPEERERVRAMLVGAPSTQAGAGTDVRRVTLLRARDLLDGLEAPRGTSEIDVLDDHFSRLWRWIPKRDDKETSMDRLPTAVRAMLEEFPALEATETTERAHSLMQLVFSSAKSLIENEDGLKRFEEEGGREHAQAPREALGLLMRVCIESDVVDDDPGLETVAREPDSTARIDPALGTHGFQIVSRHWTSLLDQEIAATAQLTPR